MNNDFTTQNDFLDQIDELMEDTSLSTIERDAKIKTCFIGMIFDIAGKCKEYLPWRKNLHSNGDDIKPIDDILAVLGSMLKSAFTMWQKYGADYKALGSVLNANPDIINCILIDGMDEEPFVNLILYYGLAKKHYPEIEIALVKSFDIDAKNDCSDLKEDLYDKIWQLSQEYEMEG